MTELSKTRAVLGFIAGTRPGFAEPPATNGYSVGRRALAILLGVRLAHLQLNDSWVTHAATGMDEIAEIDTDKLREYQVQIVAEIKQRFASARRHRLIATILRWTTLLGLLVTMTLQGLVVGARAGRDIEIAVLAVTAVATVAAAVAAFFGISERAALEMQTAMTLERELRDAELRTGAYRPEDTEEEVLRRLADSAQAIKAEERARALGLEQRPA